MRALDVEVPRTLRSALDVEVPWKFARTPASVTVLRNEIYVEVHDARGMDVVDRALLNALFQAGVGAGKEGPYVTTAVAPPVCYGKVRIKLADPKSFQQHVDAALQAALFVLRHARCAVTVYHRASCAPWADWAVSGCWVGL